MPCLERVRDVRADRHGCHVLNPSCDHDVLHARHDRLRGHEQVHARVPKRTVGSKYPPIVSCPLSKVRMRMWLGFVCVDVTKCGCISLFKIEAVAP